ncbi:PA14 domain-containing protein [Coraliomargarita akajimensis]|uniref:PA14 domain-containing protein n=1 Tax=Coraliomargarita akajimensis TaxID=395922 RepID=UPI00059EDC6A|nr:PA14 domain-containing protein [Coraliomargarita akajimensis]
MPHATDFEPSSGYTVNLPLNGIGSWTTTSTDVKVSDVAAQGGNQSIKIPISTPEHIVSFSYDPQLEDVVYLDYYLKSGPSAVPSLPLLTTPETTAVLVMQSAGPSQAEWTFLNGDGLGSGDWLPSGSLVELDASGVAAWQRITLRLDITNSLWDAYVGGELLAADLSFVEPVATSAEAFNIYGSGSGATYLDTFSIGTANPLFVDADSDGIDDNYELANGLDVTVNDRNLDLDSDGITNLQEYIIGLNPQDATDAIGDLDDDGYSNYTELLLGTNPNVFSGSVPGVVVLSHWSGISGTSIGNNLKKSANYPNNPSSVSTLTGLQFPSNIGDNYGNEVRGFIIPPESGTYYFWVASNDNGCLYLSTDGSFTNLPQTAYVIGTTNPGQWNKSSTQKSSAITLTAGQRYYFEAAHKEESRSDHFSVAWTKPDGTFELIPASALASVPPNDVDLDGYPDHLEQAIIDADPNDALTSLADVSFEDDFDQDGLSNFQEWKLSTDPSRVDTDGDGLDDAFELTSDHYDPLDASDADTDHDLDGYTVSIEVELGSDPDVFTSSVAGAVVVDEWNGISGNEVSLLLASPNYPDSPSQQFVAQRVDFSPNKDNYGYRIRGLIQAPLSGSYVFQIKGDDTANFYLSDSESVDGVSLVASFGSHTYDSWTRYSGQTSAPIALVQGQSYFFEIQTKEGGGGDYFALRWTRPDGVTEILDGAVLASMSPNDIDLDQFPDSLELAIIDADPNDSISNLVDVLPTDDFDQDGLSNEREWQLGYSSLSPDMDDDGLLDGIEQMIIDFDPNDAFATMADVLPNDDFDGDTVSNLQEQQIGSNPTNPHTAGMTHTDAFEWALINASATDGLVLFSDITAGHRSPDINEAGADIDGDGLTNIDEHSIGLSPILADSDGDGLDDKWELDAGYSALANEGQNGAFGDLDGDRLTNEMESVMGTLVNSPNADVSLPNTASAPSGQVHIVLIGIGAFNLSETDEASTLN